MGELPCHEAGAAHQREAERHHQSGVNKAKNRRHGRRRKELRQRDPLQRPTDLNRAVILHRDQCFAQNKIDLSVLPHLTDQDLKDIGVPLGHRRKMLAAIRGLPGELPVASKTVLTGEAKAQDTAERRQVTVMFSDLVGSTALSARMDPEDLREVISAYQKCVAGTVQRFGGFVAK